MSTDSRPSKLDDNAVRASLGEGDRLPEIVVEPPGPRALALSAHLDRYEAPGINTLVEGETLVWAAARGANVVDVDGNRYVDLTAGFGAASVGHRHPSVVRAVTEQSGKLVHGLGDVHPHPPRIELARRLAEWLPIDDPVVYFAVSGSDAIEIALKTAQLYTGRPDVLAFEPSYHGLTLGSLSVTSRGHFRAPFDDILRPGIHQLPFGVELGTVEDTLQEHPVGSIIVEPIVGREGVILPPPGWLSGLASLAKSNGALLIVDEVLTGFGRTGARFAVDHEAVRPDIVVCGKGLAGGMPIGLAAARREVMESWRSPGEARHTATFVAHPLACAGALAVLDLLESESFAERAADLGQKIESQLNGWETRFAVCRAVRGRGLLWGLEFDSPDTTSRVARELLKRGYIALGGGADGTVLELSPPLTIDEIQLDAAIQTLESILATG